jgi:hypothetical protein
MNRDKVLISSLRFDLSQAQNGYSGKDAAFAKAAIEPPTAIKRFREI